MNKILTANISKYTIVFAVIILLVPIHFASANAIGQFFYENIVLGFFGWILGMSGSVLDYSINTFIIGFGSEFASGGMGVIVDEMWATIRDLFNLTFIFGLVYIGFKMILRTDDGQTRRWLISLILAALLVNFSLFISKFVIDFTNILSVEIINLGVEGEIFSAVVGEGGAQQLKLSESMQDLTRIVTSVDNAPGLAEKTDASFSVIFGTMMIFIVATFVYLSAAIMIIIRGAVLVILMILSPFLFIGMVLPMLQNTSSKLWKMLFKRAFFAPVYVAFLFITLSLAGSFMSQLDSNFAEALAGSSDGASTASANATAFGPFILIIAFLIISLMAAQKLGVEGANSAMKIGNSMRRVGQRTVGSATFGMGARLGRNTAGAGASAMANNRRFRSLASQKGLTGFAARTAMRSTQKVADSSFDARSIGGLGKKANLGQAKKGGFTTRQKEDLKRKEDMLKQIGTTDTDTPEGEAEVASFESEMSTKSQQHEANKDKTAAELEQEMQKLTLAIEGAENKLVRDRDIITPTEKAERQGAIDQQKQRLEATKILLEEKEKIEELDTEIANLQAEEGKLADGSPEAAKVRAKKQAVSQQRDGLKANVNAMGQNYSAKAANAKNEIKYRDRTTYIKSLEESQKFKQNLARVLSGKALVDYAINKTGAEAGYMSSISTAGSGAAGAMAGVGALSGAGATISGGAVSSGMAYMDGQTISELKKRYGSDTRNMASKDKENDNRDAMRRIMEELNTESKGAAPKSDPADKDSGTGGGAS